MSDPSEIQTKILETKEQRWLMQKELVVKFKVNLISFKLNIPSWPKTSELIVNAFTKALEDFLKFLAINSIHFDSVSTDATLLGLEAYQISKYPAKKLKELTTAFEENYPIGRLLDIDVMNQKGIYLERKIKRKCFLCEEHATDCMRLQRHTQKELRNFVDTELTTYLENY
jgi:holo-ACP synthase CitX